MAKLRALCFRKVVMGVVHCNVTSLLLLTTKQCLGSEINLCWFESENILFVYRILASTSSGLLCFAFCFPLLKFLDFKYRTPLLCY